MYSIYILVVILALSEANDIRLGYATARSRKIYSEIKEANPALWTRSEDIVVNSPQNEIIDAVLVTDLRDYKDGYAYVESGGIGMKSVTIKLTSPSILRGYKFLIEVYANDPNEAYRYKGYSQPYVNYPSDNYYHVKGAQYYGDAQYARKY